MGYIIALIGRGGSGKSTIAEYITDIYKVHPLPIYTTRPRRKGELVGKPYIFENQRNANANNVWESSYYFTDQETGNETLVYYRHEFWDKVITTNNIFILESLSFEDLKKMKEVYGSRVVIPILIRRSDEGIARSLAERALKQDENTHPFTEMIRRYNADKENYEFIKNEERRKLLHSYRPNRMVESHPIYEVIDVDDSYEITIKRVDETLNCIFGSMLKKRQ